MMGGAQRQYPLDFVGNLGYSSRMSYWKGKTAIVTGGSSGLGRVIAQSLVDAGANVVIGALEPEGVELAAKELGELAQDVNRVLGVAVDITTDEGVQKLFDAALERFGQLDVLVNNAGRTHRGKVENTTPDEFREWMELNFIAMVRCTRAAIPYLLPRRGHVVNIGSLASKSAARWVGTYPATKFAVAAYSQQLRLELGPQGLHTLLVCPGPVARKDDRLYPLAGTEGIPEEALRPGAGVKTSRIAPEKLAAKILQCCERRKPELVVPGKARILFALSQLWPSLGDWIVLRKT